MRKKEMLVLFVGRFFKILGEFLGGKKDRYKFGLGKLKFILKFFEIFLYLDM